MKKSTHALYFSFELMSLDLIFPRLVGVSSYIGINSFFIYLNNLIAIGVKERFSYDLLVEMKLILKTKE